MNTIIAWPALLDPDEAARYCGGKKNLTALEKRHGLGTYSKEKRNVRYLRTHIDAALERAAAKV